VHPTPAIGNSGLVKVRQAISKTQEITVFIYENVYARQPAFHPLKSFRHSPAATGRAFCGLKQPSREGPVLQYHGGHKVKRSASLCARWPLLFQFPSKHE
jgi:hypothetical protein